MDLNSVLNVFCSKNTIDSKPNTLLISILENIIKNPEEGKFKRINIEKVVKKLGDDGVGVLTAIGFVKSDTHYEIASPDFELFRSTVSSLKRVHDTPSGGNSSEGSDTSMRDVSVSEVKRPDADVTENQPETEVLPEESAATDTAKEETTVVETAKEEKVVKKPIKKPTRSFAERGGVSGSGIDLEAELDRRFNDGSSKYSAAKSKKKTGISGLDLNSAVDKLGGDDKYSRAMKSGKKIPKSNIVNLAESIDGVQHKKIITTRKKGPNISNLDAAIDGDTSKTIQKRKTPKAKVNPTMLDAALEEM